MGLGGSRRRGRDRLVIGRSRVRIPPRALKRQVRRHLRRCRPGSDNGRSFLWTGHRAAGALAPLRCVGVRLAYQRCGWASFAGPRRSKLWKADDWIGLRAGLALARIPENRPALRRHFLSLSIAMYSVVVPRKRLRLAGLKGFRVVNAAHSLDDLGLGKAADTRG